MMSPSEELNRTLEGTVAYRLLSGLGRRFYFPKGIIAQSAEAKQAARFANGTIGMAYQNGRPLILSAIAGCMPTLSPEESVAYAPTAGVEKARLAWRDLIIQKNPSIKGEYMSLPAVVPGLTAGLSYTADMFFDEGDRLLVSDPCWDNYGLIFETRRGVRIREVPFFGAGPGLDLDSIGRAVREEAKTGAVRILLNFPNNPSGYSPTIRERESLVEILYEAAESGADVLALCDDAYFGLFYEDDISKESTFAHFASLHDRIFAVKVDGPIKEDYIWGFRMGFITYAGRGLLACHHDALIRKLMGAIRSSVSCANTPAQHIMLRAMENMRTPPEKEEFLNIMRGRYQKIKSFIRGNPPHPVLKPLPFNSGYFMCFRCEGLSAETLRRELLAARGIGAVSLGDRYLRIAFAGIDEEKIEAVYRAVYDTAARLCSS
ncbi:MAG: aminotransferase class I/II-fold pyridoxal phosphate-dependent enzyme [Treponema sp.]|jgi:aspartate/methionine/tyrosine aminotransferase|nr:aminotransferase class I/II-fold pyridoxal phosphate-dependent enzyme [Treponema sp.]